MTMHGADADGLETLATRFDAGAQLLRRAASTITAQLGSSPWEGRRAQAFRSDWSRSHRVSLIRTADDLAQAAQALRRNAQAQRSASGVSAGGSGPGSPATTTAQWGGVSLSPERLDAIRDRFDLGRDVIGAGAFAAWMLRNRSVLSHLNANVRNVFHLSANARTAAVSLRTPSVALAGVGVALDGWDLGRALESGDTDQAIRSGIGLTIGIAGAAIPVVGQAKAAWDVGYLVGTGASAAQQRVFNTEGKTVDWAVQQYGTQDIGTRYNGWSGFGRWAKDSFRIR
jgi:uncharacterized protein YukE